MQMHIRHETWYRYERPVKYSVQSLHLTPRRDLSQRALTWSIAAPGRRLEQIDAYGNISHLLTIEEPHHDLNLAVRLFDGEKDPKERAQALAEAVFDAVRYKSGTSDVQDSAAV